MSLVDRIRNFVLDPPPAHLFELSAEGVAWSVEGRLGFTPLPPGTLHIQPQADNVADLEALVRTLERIAPEPAGQRKRRPCVVLLPDYAGRITVLDFDSFPGKPEEQQSLVRFRVKKSLPFDADAAALAFYPQPAGTRREVVIAAVSLDILSRYEAAFRAAGYHPGRVTISSLAALDLVDAAPGLVMTVRLSGRVLTVTAATEDRLRLTRCIELTSVTPEEVSNVLLPTVAFAEDEFAMPLAAVYGLGIDEAGAGAVPESLPLRSVLSPAGPVTGENAGLLGYLRSQQEGRQAA